MPWLILCHLRPCCGVFHIQFSRAVNYCEMLPLTNPTQPPQLSAKFPPYSSSFSLYRSTGHHHHHSNGHGTANPLKPGMCKNKAEDQLITAKPTVLSLLTVRSDLRGELPGAAQPVGRPDGWCPDNKSSWCHTISSHYPVSNCKVCPEGMSTNKTQQEAQ